MKNFIFALSLISVICSADEFSDNVALMKSEYEQLNKKITSDNIEPMDAYEIIGLKNFYRTILEGGFTEPAQCESKWVAIEFKYRTLQDGGAGPFYIQKGMDLFKKICPKNP